MNHITEHDPTGADVEMSRAEQVAATINRLLFEASDVSLRLELFLHSNRKLTGAQLAKLATVADRIDAILAKQEGEAA